MQSPRLDGAHWWIWHLTGLSLFDFFCQIPQLIQSRTLYKHIHTHTHICMYIGVGTVLQIVKWRSAFQFLYICTMYVLLIYLRIYNIKVVWKGKKKHSNNLKINLHFTFMWQKRKNTNIFSNSVSNIKNTYSRILLLCETTLFCPCCVKKLITIKHMFRIQVRCCIKV